MVSAIETRAYELSTEEYSAAMVALLRRRMVWFDLLAAVIVVLISKFVIRWDWPLAIGLGVLVPVVGFLKTPRRVRRMAETPNSPVPSGTSTFHIDAEGIVYSGSDVGPLILKWDEIRSVKMLGGIYVVDAGSDDILVPPRAFAAPRDESEWQSMVKKQVRRVSGF